MPEADQPSGTIRLLGEQTEKAWPLFSPAATPEEFYRRMTAGLPEGTNLIVVLNKDGTPKQLGYGYADGNRAFDFVRKFDGAHVDHENAGVSASLQKEGISKTVNGHLFRLYQEIGIEKITMSAAFIGTYAWARVGFVPEQDDWNKLRYQIGKRLDYLEQNPSPQEGPLPYKYVDALRGALKSDDPKNFWFIVDQGYPYYGTSMGKLLTLDIEDLPEKIPRDKKAKIAFLSCSGWLGSLDMKDPDCVQRFEAYIYEGKSRNPSLRKKPASRMTTENRR